MRAKPVRCIPLVVGLFAAGGARMADLTVKQVSEALAKATPERRPTFRNGIWKGSSSVA